MRHTPIIATAASLAAAAGAAGQAPPLLWGHQFGTPAFEFATAVALDPSGDILVAGKTFGNLAGPQNGRGEAFLRRLTADGAHVQTYQFGSPFDDSAYAVLPDGAGGAYVAGTTFGAFAAPFGGGIDAFVTRLDAKGNQVWAHQFASSSVDRAEALAPGPAGTVYAALTYAFTNHSAPNGLVVKYDAAGTELWRRIMGRELNLLELGGATPDPDGGVYVCGTVYAPTQQMDAYLGRIAADGTVLWERTFGAYYDDYALAAAPDGEGGVYVAGYVHESASNVPDDAFIARFDRDGNQLWFRQFGSAAGDRANAVAPDGEGGVIVAGLTDGDFTGRSAGQSDIFVCRYSPAGVMTWARQIGTAGSDWAEAIATAPDGSLVVAGTTTGALFASPLGENDAFVLKIGSGACYPNCDGSTTPPILNVADFICFQNHFLAGDPYANCDGSTTQPVLTVNDYACFAQRFIAGCNK